MVCSFVIPISVDGYKLEEGIDGVCVAVRVGLKVGQSKTSVEVTWGGLKGLDQSQLFVRRLLRGLEGHKLIFYSGTEVLKEIREVSLLRLCNLVESLFNLV